MNGYGKSGHFKSEHQREEDSTCEKRIFHRITYRTKAMENVEHVTVWRVSEQQLLPYHV